MALSDIARGFAGRRVVVTGAASGIGLAVAQALDAAGAALWALDRNPAPFGRAIVVDLGDPASIRTAAAAVAGGVDALFNCAGLAPTQPPLDIVKANFLGTRDLTGLLVPRMAAGGAIVSVSSNGGLAWRERLPLLRALLATPDFESGLRWVAPRLDEIGNAYRFAKEALTAWTLAEAQTLIARGIRINCTSPGAVRTPMLEELEQHVPAAAIDRTAQPIGRRSTPDEQAAPILFLASDAAAYVNGVDLPVDGGFAAQRDLGLA